MENVLNRMDPLFAGLWHSTWQASVLICLVLLVQRLVGKKLSPGWRYSLWLLVLARLALPFTPQSALSIFNLRHFDAFRPSTPAVPSYENLSTPPADYRSLKHRSHPISIVPSAGQEVPTSALIAAQTSQGSDRSAMARRLAAWIPPIWLFGVLLQIARICWQNGRFATRVRDRVPITKTEVVEVLEECKRTMKIRLRIALFETSLVRSPALYGLFRPRLLLPQNLIESFSRQELRHVLLHELAHMKRSDMVINWLMTVLQILHWFNPLVWFAFSRMRADRESACDAFVLTKASETDAKAYGTTIIRLLEDLARPARAPSLMGILEEKSQMRQRIQMIAHFRKPSRWSACAVMLLVGLGLVGLTDARIPQPLNPAAEKPQLAKPVPASVQVRGKVIDETTATPIEAFKLVLIENKYITNGLSSIEPHTKRPAGTGTNGEFTLPIQPNVVGGRLIYYDVEVRADGYVAERLGWHELADGDQNHVFSLAKSVPLEGLLRLPDGQPAGDVEVALRTSESSIMFDQTGFLNRHISLITRTDAEGRFLFKPEDEALEIIAVDERGYAESKVDSPLTVQRLTLRPWGRVEGRLMVGKNAGQGEKVGLTKTTFSMLPCTTTADSDGRFVFERVPPGDFTLSRGGFFAGISVRVRSAETIHAKLGGTGSRIVGRLIWPDAGREIDWKSKNCETRFSSKALPPPGSLPISLQSDGSFAIDDVLPGVYRLVVIVREPGTMSFVSPPLSGSTNVQPVAVGVPAKPVAILEKTVEVPPSPQNAEHSPMDIGTLPLKMWPSTLGSNQSRK